MMRRVLRKLHYYYRLALCRLLGVETWHANPPGRHAYHAVILARVNAMRPASVLELGCGFGDIICKTRARYRLGTDAAAGVLTGAKFCHPLLWLSGGISFRKLLLGQALQGRFDAILCVNFIHIIAPTDLGAAIAQLARDNLEAGGLMVFDVMDNPRYTHNHDAAYLLEETGLAFEIVPGFEFGRSLVFARKPA
jgi:SAM-dependent methyltransferase